MESASPELDLLRTACDGLPAGLMLLRALRDDDGAIADFECVFLNRAAAGVLELELDQLRGERLLPLLPGERDGAWLRALQAVVETGRPCELELRGVRGRCTRVADGVSVLLPEPEPEPGRPPRLPLEPRTIDLLMQAPFGISIVHGPEHRFVLANPRYEQMVGRSGLAGKTMREAFPELHADAPVLKMLDEVRATGRPFSADEFRVPLDLDEDGVLEDHYFRFTCAPVREGGEVVAIQTAAFEVSSLVESRHRAEEAAERLADNERRLRATFETAAVGIAHLAPDGRWLRFNERLRQLLGYSREELTALTFQDVTHPDDVADDVAQAAALLRGDIGSYQLEKRYVRKDGTAVWVNVTGSLVRDDDGHPLFFVAIVEDISERKAVEEALHQASREKDEFLAMLSHELRNPLAAVRSASELLETVDSSDPVMPRIRQVLERQTSHMARLLDDLLDLARITSGRLTIEPVRLDLCEVVLEVVSDFGPSAREIRFTVDVPPSPLWVRGDRIRLAQVTHNLIGNALKYTPPRGTVSVRLTKSRDGALLTVIDSGIGLDPELQSRLFKPFQQAPQDIARSAGGLGLGLAISKTIVELHRGTISAHSEGRDCGSEFQVWLPLAEPDPGLPECPAPERPDCMRIMLVEDNEDAAELFAALLRARGHDVRIAARGHEALESLDELDAWRPDAIVCDIGLPDIDGYAVARAIRSDPRLSQVRLLALSGYGQDEDRRRSADAGFDAHFTKPTDVAEILRAIRDPALPARPDPDRR